MLLQKANHFKRSKSEKEETNFARLLTARKDGKRLNQQVNYAERCPPLQLRGLSIKMFLMLRSALFSYASFSIIFLFTLVIRTCSRRKSRLLLFLIAFRTMVEPFRPAFATANPSVHEYQEALHSFQHTAITFLKSVLRHRVRSGTLECAPPLQLFVTPFPLDPTTTIGKTLSDVFRNLGPASQKHYIRQFRRLYSIFLIPEVKTHNTLALFPLSQFHF